MKNFTIRKFVALAMSATMIFSMAACGNNDEKKTSAGSETSSGQTVSESQETVVAEPKDPVTITFWYRNDAGEQEYTDRVEQRLNEILAADNVYNYVSIDLMPCGSSYATDFQLAQASRAQIDLVSNYGLQFTTEVENGSFMELDDLLAQFPEATEELPDWLMEMQKIDGVTYGIPNQQQAANEYFIVTPKEYLDNSGYTADEIHEIFASEDKTPADIAEFCENYLLAIRKYTGKETKWITYKALTDFELYWNLSNTDITGIGAFTWDIENNEWMDRVICDTMKEAYKYTAEFYQKGYIHPDIATIGNAPFQAKNFLNDESYVFALATSVGTPEMVSAQYTKSYGFETVAIPVSDYLFLPPTWAAAGVSISSTCEHPEEAMAVLTMLENSKYEEFYNTLVYGLEDIHYTKNSDGTIKTLEYDGSQGNAECSYTCWKFAVGNTFNAWLNQSGSEELQQYIKDEINSGNKLVYSPVVGYSYKTADIDTEISQVKASKAEYNNALCQGIKGADWENYYNEYKTRMEAAGIYKILEELNKQTEEYLNSK